MEYEESKYIIVHLMQNLQPDSNQRWLRDSNSNTFKT